MKRTALIILFFICLLASSQNGEDFYSFHKLSVSDGLSQSAVGAIEQDQFKQMWIGTRDGLNKYDGERITIYRNDLDNPNSISDNDISSIKEDQDGVIWIGTRNGLNRFDPRTEKFKAYYHSNRESNSIPHNTIRVIEQMDNGELWFGTTSGLAIYDANNDAFINYKNIKNETTSLSKNTISSIYKDDDGEIWIGTSSGLNKVINKEKNNLSFKRYSGLEDKTKGLFVQSILKGKYDDLLIGTRYNGLYVFNKKNEEFTKFNDRYNDHVTSLDIRKLQYDKDGTLWIGTYDGLFLKKENNKIIQVTNQQGNSKSLSKNSIKDLYLDNNGSMWIGTYYGGINLWDKSSNNFQTLLNLEDNKATSLGVVNAIQQSIDETLFIGTEDNQVVAIDKSGKTNSSLTEELKSGLQNINVKSLLIDNQKLWIGTLKNGVRCFDIENKKFIDSELSSLFLNELSDIGIYSIQKNENYLIFGTFGKGVIVYDTEQKKHVKIEKDAQDKNSLSNNKVRSIFVDQQKNIWITVDNGINFISSNENLFAEKVNIKRYFFRDKKNNYSKVFCVNEGAEGQIFVGTKNNGLLYLVDGEFQKVDLKLLNKNLVSIYAILKGDLGKLWISSNLGIINYDPNLKKSIVYNQSESIKGNEFTANACLKSKEDTFYFGGINGVSLFNPKTFYKNETKFKVVLTDLKIEGKNSNGIQPNESKDLESIKFLKELTLNHSEASFSLGFTIPNYTNTLKNHYAYRLLGLNDKWIYSNSPEVNYTIQKPGNYTFEVKEAILGDVMNGEITALKIKVKPAPWLTKWAFFAYFLITGFILYSIYRNMRTKLILAHKLKTERLEKIKQKEINSSKIEFFTNIAHDFKTPLTLVLAPLQQLIKNYKGDKQVFNKLLVIQKNGNQLLKLINQLMDFRSLEGGSVKLNVKEIDITRLVETVFSSFNEYADIKKYTYTFNSALDNSFIYCDTQELEKVFYNIISNAFKYTPKGGEINVSINDTKDAVCIKVSDNGRGIDKAFIDKIFNKYYEVPDADDWLTQFNNGSGVGLNIAQNIIKLHHGKIKVESKENEGTTFSILLKKGRQHFKDLELFADRDSNAKSHFYKEQNEVVEHLFLDKVNIQDINAKENKPKVLIVDDNEDFRQFIIGLLKDNYNVIQAPDGKLAFKQAIKFMPNLIVSDVIMPNTNGVEFCSKIKNDERTRHIPFVLLTSRSSKPFKYKGLESGADAYINKPFDINEFLFIVKNQLFTSLKIKNSTHTESTVKVNANPDSFDDKLFKKAIKIVQTNLGNSDFDIHYFANELGLSRTGLFSKVKEWTNKTPNEFIISIKMKKAAELLELGELSIAEIGYMVSFKDPKYFSKSFKKYYGRSPSEYAEKFYS